MLTYAAAGASDSAEVGSRVASLGAQLLPYAHSRRALADLAMQPARAFKYAVPHVLLTSLGHTEPALDRFFRSRCRRAVALGSDLPPSAHLERTWITRLWGADWTAAAPQRTLADQAADVLSDSREDAYALTHQLFYLTDFGRSPPQLPPATASRLLGEVEALLLRYLDAEDYDAAGELLMTWPELRVPWSPAAAFAFRVLARAEDEAGVLPCGNVDLARLSRLDPDGRRRYARATGYHTAFVMGLLCAASLRDDSLPPLEIEGEQYPDRVWERAWQHIDPAQGHWLDDFTRASAAEKRVLTPTLCNLAVAQQLRRHDYAGLARTLTLATEAGLPDHPLRSAAVDRLQALDEAVTLADAATPADVTAEAG